MKLKPEQKEIDIVFGLLDITNQGRISVPEAVLGLRAMNADIDVDGFIKQLSVYQKEADEMSTVTKEIFRLIACSMSPGLTDTNLILRSFYALDTSGKGYLSPEDLRLKISELDLDIRNEDIDNMISFADPEDCGYITAKNFVQAIKKGREYCMNGRDVLFEQ